MQCVGMKHYVATHSHILCRVSRDDEDSGWENGWGDDDTDVASHQQKRSSSNSPPRGTGVGKLKKGTFAKKKPANWSNDF